MLVGLALALVIALRGTVATMDVDAVTAKLRDLAVTAGCPKDDVRVALRWQGQGEPLEVEVWCAKPQAAPQGAQP